MSNKIRDKIKRQRMSVQNKDLIRKLDLAIDDLQIKEEEPEVTQEEDPIKYFSQQQRKKEKELENEKKKLLMPINEEVEDPLQYFEKKENENKEQDPMQFLKNIADENIENIENTEPKILGELYKHDEEKLAERIKKGDLPDEIVIKKEIKPLSEEIKEKKMYKRMQTSLMFSQRVVLVARAKDKLIKRLQESKESKQKVMNQGNIVQTANNDNGGTSLLGAEAQIDPNKQPSQTVKQTKEIDLKNFMVKK